MGHIEFATQLLSQLGVTFVGIVLGIWAAVKLVSKEWFELRFEKLKEEHKQELQHYYREQQESFKQKLGNYYQERMESFKQALTGAYAKELETHKAGHQEQLDRAKAIMAERLEGTKAE